MRLLFAVVLGLAVLFSVSPARAQASGPGAGEWLIDPPHCAVTFEVKHIFVQIPGRFHQVGGVIRFDPERPEQGSIDALIATGSVDTAVGKRDDHLRSPDFFDALKYPWMRFKSSKIVRRSADSYVVTGELTIKDVTKTVEIPLKYHGVKDDPLRDGMQVLGLEGGLVIDRLEYHVGDGKYYKMGVTGKDVEIGLHLELIRAKP